jgi:hypothetical protein
MKNSWKEILSWKIMSDVYYDFEELLRKKNIHFKTKDGVITIDHEGYIYLYSLTQLPDNVYFNNKGYVSLDSLTQLPDNVYFNNEGFVYLYSLTQLPENVIFNNKGFVDLYSLTQLPDNKEQIFKNDGIVYYNRDTKTYDPRTRKLSWDDFIYNHPDHQDGLRRLIEKLDKKGIPHKSIADPSGYRKSQVILIETGNTSLYVNYFDYNEQYRLYKMQWNEIANVHENFLDKLIEDIESELL